MPNMTRLTKTLGDQTATVAIIPSGEVALAMVLVINDRVTDKDVAEYDSAAERDASYAQVVADMRAAGYTDLP